jgi:hypothetical protein
MKGEHQGTLVFIPIYNGTYFDALFKLASKLSEKAEFRFLFFFGNNYPNQEKHLAILKGKFDFLLSNSREVSLLRSNRVLFFLRSWFLIDELLSLLELNTRIRILKRELSSIWGDTPISLCLFPANNRYIYPFISNFAKTMGTPCVIVPQWFAGPKEIEESLSHSKIYRPNIILRITIRVIAPEYLRKIDLPGRSFQMIPQRFSEILLARIHGYHSARPWILHSGHSDRIFVETVSAYTFARSLGFEEKHLALTGSVYLDEMVVERSESKIRVLVAVAPDMFSSRVNIELEFDSYQDYVISLCTELIQLGYGDATFSMHPSDTGKYFDLIRGFGFEISSEPLHLLLVRTEIFLATISATIQWANHLSIPTVNFDFYHYNYPDYKNLPLVIGVHEQCSLRKAINEAADIVRMNSSANDRGYKIPMHNAVMSVDRIIDEINVLTGKRIIND